MAFVSCCVFLTERMRRRMSNKTWHELGCAPPFGFELFFGFLEDLDQFRLDFVIDRLSSRESFAASAAWLVSRNR